METPWKVLGLTTSLLFLELCNGFPINLENSGPDSQAQFLTGLVAVLLAVCSVVLLVGCLCCQRKNGFKEFRDSPVVASVASNLDHGHVNPISGGEFTIFTPISPPHHNNNVFLANQRIVSRAQEDYKYGDIDVTSWFDGTEADFPRTRLKYIRELGKGWFGRVVEGTAQGLTDESNESEWTPVVVRILEASATSRDRVLFLHDATIYRCGRHANILQIFGRSLDTVPLLLLQEYCVQGDMKRYLRDRDAESEKFLSSDLPLLWCCQLTTAVKFLHDRKVTHPDLAARNCQLTNDLSLKLGDYGLSATFYPEDYYQGSPGVPLRWCAPETISYTSTTIQSKKMTMEANVWSLGVTMWEIFDCGEQPYSWLTDDEVISHVLGSPKVRLPRPTYNLIYTDYIYRLMQSCWSTSESRPIISHVDLILADLTQVLQNVKHTDRIDATASIQDFDKRWESLKPNAFAKPDNDYLDAPETIDRKFSASLNNLHGSLDNLLERRPDPMESWLENVASDTGDMSYVHGLSQAIKDLDNAIALENVSSDSSHQPSPVPDPAKQNKLQFKLGQLGRVLKPKYSDLEHDEDSILYMHRTSSESETEDETWKKKIERGVYTEKVRQKSRSVADLMVLTHIDCSESDSETMPSLDYKVNCNGKLRHDNFKFGSEGNLLSVKGTFQDELKKLQEERRDSLLFVPDKFSQSSFSDANYADRSPVKKLIDELNHPSEMIPPQQVYNVFNVSVNQKYPIRTIANESKTGKSISDNLITVSNENQNGFNLNVSSVINSDIPKTDGDGKTFEDARFFTDVKHGFDYLEDQDENASLLMSASPRENRRLDGVDLVGVEKISNDVENFVVESSQNCNQQTNDSYKKWSQEENEKNLIPADVPKLSQIIQSNVELSGYIMSNQANEVKLKTDDSKHNLTVTVIDKDSGLNTPENSASLEKLDDEEEEHFDFSKMYETSRSRNFPEDNEDASCNASFDSDRSNLMTSDDIKDNKMESTDEEIGDLKDEGPFDVVIHNKGNEFGAKLENSLALNSLEYVPIDENKKDYDTNNVQGSGIESNLLETKQVEDTSLPNIQLYVSTSNKNIEDNAINVEEVNSLKTTPPHIKNIMNVELVNEIKWGTSLDIELNESDVRIDDEIPRNYLEESKQNQFSTNLLNSTRDESDKITDDYVENKPNEMQDGDTQNKRITSLSLPNDSKSIESSRSINEQNSSPITEVNSNSELNEAIEAVNCVEGLNDFKTKNDAGEDLISSLNEPMENFVDNFDLKQNDNEDKLNDNLTHPSEEKNHTGNYTSPSIVQDFLDHEIKNSFLSETKQIINVEEIPSLSNKDVLNLGNEVFNFEGNVHEDKLKKTEHISSNHPSEEKNSIVNYTSRNIMQEFLDREIKNSSTTFETRKIVNNEEISNLIDNTDTNNLTQIGCIEKDVELKEQPTEIEIEEKITQTFNLIDSKDPVDLEQICVGCIEDLLEEKDGELKEEPTEIEIEEKFTNTFNQIDIKDPVDLEQICVTKLAPVGFEETRDINNLLEDNFKFLQSDESNDTTDESKFEEVEDNSTKLTEFLSHEIKNCCTTSETKEIANKEETLETRFVIKEETVNLIDDKDKLGARVGCIEDDASLQPKIAIEETNAFNSIDTRLDLENKIPKTQIKDFEETRDVNNFLETNFNSVHVDDETNDTANENKLIKEDVSSKINRDLVGEFSNEDDTTNECEFIPVEDISLKNSGELAEENHETPNAQQVNIVEAISSKNNCEFIQKFLNRKIEDPHLDGIVTKVFSQENLMGHEVVSFQDDDIENSNKVVCKENLVLTSDNQSDDRDIKSVAELEFDLTQNCDFSSSDLRNVALEPNNLEQLSMDKTKSVTNKQNLNEEIQLNENNSCVTLSEEIATKDVILLEGGVGDTVGNYFNSFINESVENKCNESTCSLDGNKTHIFDETKIISTADDNSEQFYELLMDKTKNVDEQRSLNKEIEVKDFPLLENNPCVTPSDEKIIKDMNLIEKLYLTGTEDENVDERSLNKEIAVKDFHLLENNPCVTLSDEKTIKDNLIEKSYSTGTEDENIGNCFSVPFINESEENKLNNDPEDANESIRSFDADKGPVLDETRSVEPPEIETNYMNEDANKLTLGEPQENFIIDETIETFTECTNRDVDDDPSKDTNEDLQSFIKSPPNFSLAETFVNENESLDDESFKTLSEDFDSIGTTKKILNQDTNIVPESVIPITSLDAHSSEDLERFIESPLHETTFVNQLDNKVNESNSLKTVDKVFDSTGATKNSIMNQESETLKLPSEDFHSISTTNLLNQNVVPIELVIPNTSLDQPQLYEIKEIHDCSENKSNPEQDSTLDIRDVNSTFFTTQNVLSSPEFADLPTENDVTSNESQQNLFVADESVDTKCDVYLKLTQQFLKDEVENYDDYPGNGNEIIISALNNYEASINEEKSNFASTESDTTFDKTHDLSNCEIPDLKSIENKVTSDERLANKSDVMCLKMSEELLKDEMNNFEEKTEEEINISVITNKENSDLVCIDKCGCTYSNITQEFLSNVIENYGDNSTRNKSISGTNSTNLIAMDLNDATCMEFSKNDDTEENLLAGKGDIDEMLTKEIITKDLPPLKYQTFIIDEANVKEEKSNEIDETPNENFEAIGINTNENYDDCHSNTEISAVAIITSTVLDLKPETSNTQLNVTKEFLNYETLNYKDVEIDFETKIVEPTDHQQTSNVQDVIDKNDSLIYIDEPTNEIASKNDETIDANFQTTTDFLLNEIARYDSIKNTPVFDLSENQEEIAPNSLTHFTSFTSTPFVKRSMESAVILGASDDYSIDFYTGLKTTVDEAEDLKFSSNFVQDFEKSAVAQKLFDNKKEKRKNDHSDLYSLETWDNFLRKSFDDQDNRMDFHNFNEEPHSLLFLDYGDKSGGAEDDGCNKILSGDVEKVANETYEVSVNDKTYVNEAVVGNKTFTKPEGVNKASDDGRELEAKSGSWETGGGWFLHPQSNSEEPSGQMVVSQESSTGGDTYVGFSMDDEIMAAIRNELMTKLPHAQRASSDHVEDSEELDSSEKNEVFVRYNVYNTPLSPIPEESCVETDESGLVSPRDESVDDDSSDWSVQDNNSLIVFTETLSPRIADSPAKSHLHPHTPSQDSCCSNDTLFNLEELTNATDQERLLAEAAKNQPEPNKSEPTQNSPTVSDATEENNSTKHSLEVPKINVKTFVTDFLNNERYDQINGTVELSQLHSEENEEVSTTSDIYLTVSENTFSFGQSVAPLNSPEDRPWKELQASFRSCEESDSKFSEYDENLETPDAVSNLDLIEGCGSEIFEDVAKSSVDDYETATENSHPELNSDSDYANVESHVCSEGPLENAEEEKFDRFEDMYGPLADIRFSGPCSIQLMTTSFSEGNDLGEEQDWDSGSDSRSSSSGEFIWREGEHEASVKALRAAPQSGNVEDVMPMEDIQEENESTCSSGSECPEFVPSAWDKYATPTKSSLRSPEKTVERTQRNEKNPKGVWFKKQKYHCVYEYPREPDSPVLQSYDLWKPTPDFATLTDWDLDTDTYLPTADEPELVAPEAQPKVEKVHNLYHLTTFTDVNTAPTMLDEDFFINGSSRPFDMMGGLTSQFFPGKLTENWNENVTPDSGVEDITPGSATDANEYKETTAPNEVESLRNLAAAVAKQNGNKSVELGGLRHTRNKLKLDLPPSPSAFTSSKSFNVELAEEIVHRQVPTFSTFGKSRFLVQHVDTPPDDQLSKNVSFEALPYKPAKQFVKDDFDKERHKIEVVRGEASLLDSADEDSGIDSCTLERKRGVEG